jgi:two-component system NtrC family sensor kinase
LLCILFDISERLATEEHLRHLQRMEAIGQLAGGVAHDFNNLLTPILGFGEFLEAEALAGRTSPDQVRQATGEIVVAARRAQQLVSQLLLFSRRQKAEKKPLSLTSLVSGFERMLRRMIREDIEFSISIPAVRLMVHADAGQLEQLLMNLALNSQHALPGGGHFSISLTELDGQACLDVGDDGVGIEAEALPRVFEPFFTTDPEKRHGGLALASAYGIVQQHEGTISVESSPGQGTHFRILLPLVCAVPKVVPEARMAPPSGHETLLVVEDDDQVRTLVVRILENAGYTVLAANRPKHAIGLLEHFPDPVSLVLTDVVMPEMNGSEMFEKIRARRPGIRVLYMSGYPNEALGEKAAGSLDIVKKPFAIHELLARVRAALDGSLI